MNQKIVITQEEASKYIKYLLENHLFWYNVNWKFNKESNEWIFSGFINYHEQEQKIIKIINIHDYVRLLKHSLKIKNGYCISHIDYFINEEYKFKINFNLIDNYSCSRRRR